MKKTTKKTVPIKTIIYSDELKDEFSSAQITAKKIDGNYKYLKRNPIAFFFARIMYWIIILPFSFFYCKIKLHHKIKNKKVLKQAKKTGYFLYGNHTQETADAFIPALIAPREMYVIVHPNNVSMPVMGKLTPYFGALPLPDDLGAGGNFLKAIEKRIGQGGHVIIYPEAHIWPYYTKIRPFPSTSMRYPVRYNVPSFTMTTVYSKRKWGIKPKATTYIDGPFYPNLEIPKKQAEKELWEKIHGAMESRCEKENYEYYQYIKKENSHD